MAARSVLRHRDLSLYLAGVVLSQVGSRATVVASMYQIYAVTGSLSKTGLLGGVSAVGYLVASPVGGVYADRLDRRHMVQITQAVALLASVFLAWMTYGDHLHWGLIIGAMFVTAVASAFEQPARQSLIPAMVPPDELAKAVTLINPSRELAVLVGPALAGVMMSIWNAGSVYLFDVVTYAVMIALIAMVKAGGGVHPRERRPFFHEMAEGVGFVFNRRIIVALIGLDLGATVLGAYRVALPALATLYLHVGTTGYGILSAAPSFGALVATYLLIKRFGLGASVGLWSLQATALYGAMIIVLGASPLFALSLAAAVVLGGCDAIATSIRHIAIQLETTDELRGRVMSVYQVASRGGPAIGDFLIGNMAALLSPVVAMAVGGGLVVVMAGSFLARRNLVRDYVNPHG